jgi:serine/threonine protein kinase
MLPVDAFNLVNRLVEEALDLPCAEREQFVIERCGPAHDLIAETFRLLAFSNSAAGFLEPPPATGIQVGEVLGGRFRILRALGTGGTGSVYLADDRYLGEVAIKVLNPPLSRSEPATDRLVTEIRAARSIRHPNVCPVFDLFLFNDERRGSIAVFTMKYLAGESLTSRLSRAALVSNEPLEIARGIASGLDALHVAGIIHCDLKPDNIMLTSGPDAQLVPVIVDFGLAMPSGGGTAPISGSPQFMAPEQFRGGPLTTAVDVYAFGLILYEMIAKVRPFPTEDLIPAAIRRSVDDAPRLRAAAPWAPREWDEAIARALSRDPAVRPHSAVEVLDRMQLKEISPVGKTRVFLQRPCRHAATALFHGSLG